MTTIFELALDNLESNSYELQDEFNNETIASFVERLVKKARNSRSGVIDVLFGDYWVRLNNGPGIAYISCSNVDGTGVSEPCLVPIVNEGEMDEYDVDTIVSLLNQAYYYMQTC